MLFFLADRRTGNEQDDGVVSLLEYLQRFTTSDVLCFQL